MASTQAGLPAVGLYGGFSGMVPNNGLLVYPEMNSASISETVDGPSLQVRGHIRSAEFNLCLSLSREIDFAIAKEVVPNTALELPSLLKKICLWKNDTLMQAAIMVLMISVKNACHNRWFSERDSEELSNLAEEIASKFCSMPNINTDPSCSNSVITSIMSRFYPTMKMGHLFLFIEVKPGFDAYVRDFQIPSNLKSAPGDKIRLFVGQIDSIETSACLISPSKVNFLVNGLGVEKRTTRFMDTGPQNPTVLTHLLRHGSNVLQAVGEFNGNFLIAVACMSEMPKPDTNALLDYEYTPPIVDSDSEIIEEASRISLSCPISLRRIETPVKGHSCKHIQCFDFDNYVAINSRKPSWRCPHCNQHVCFNDLRIDQKMVKILKEVGRNVTDVIFASDGSWNAVLETDVNTHKSEDGTLQNESPQPESVGLLNVPVDILDLTQNDSMDVTPNETEDQKVSSSALQSQSFTQTMAVDPYRTNTNDVNQSIGRAEDDTWFRIYMSTFGPGSLNFMPNTRNNGAYASTTNHITAPPVIPEFPTTALNRVGTFPFPRNALASTSVPQNETSFPSPLPPQQYQFGNPTITNEYGRFPSLLRQAYPAAPTNTNSTITLNPLHLSPFSNQYPVIQNGWQQNGSQASVRSTHQNVTQHSPSQVQNTYPGASGRQISSQQMVNIRRPQAPSQSHCQIQAPAQPPAHFLRPSAHMGVSQDRTRHVNDVMNSQQAHLIAAANRAMLMALDPSRTLATPTSSMNTGTSSMPSVGNNVTNPADQNWRPAGRMRGALSGQAFTDALNEYITRPSQQAAQHVSNVNSLLNSIPPTTIFHG